MDDGTPHKEFRFATDDEAAMLEATKVSMHNYVNADGWMQGYVKHAPLQAYFYDSVAHRWLVPEGDWQAKDPLCLAADAIGWAETQ